MDTLVTLTGEKNNYFKFPITNKTSSNITLSKKKEIGRLEYINFIKIFVVQLNEQQHAPANTAISSINNQSNSIFKEHQQENSTNHFY